MAAPYDLVVIGAGSGGMEAAWNAAVTYKARVAVVDVQTSHGPPYFAALGGTCVNVGCIPKKLFVAAASYRDHFKESAGFGYDIRGSEVRHSWAKLIEEKNKVITGLNESYTGMFTEAKMDFVQGFASLASPTEVVVRNGPNPEAAAVLQTLTTKHVLVATGSWPFAPDVPGRELCITSNEAFYLPEAPRRVLIVGGGYIAVEFASIFNSFSEEVHLAYRGPLFLRGFDTALCEALRDQMTARGVKLHFKENPAKVERVANGALKVTMESGTELEVDCVMYATGRTPRSDNLGLEKLGVQLKNKAVVVDAHSKTAVDNIYAIGDVTNRVMLTPVAIHEGAAFATTVFGKTPTAPCHDNIAAAVFSIPPIGTVGLTEADAAKKYPNVAVYESSFTPLFHKISGATFKKFLVKLIVDHTTSIVVGVHLLGADSPEIVQPVGILMRLKATIQDYYSTIGVHPTSAEEMCSLRTPSYFVVNGVKQDTPPASL